MNNYKRLLEQELNSKKELKELIKLWKEWGKTLKQYHKKYKKYSHGKDFYATEPTFFEENKNNLIPPKKLLDYYKNKFEIVADLEIDKAIDRAIFSLKPNMEHYDILMPSIDDIKGTEIKGMKYSKGSYNQGLNRRGY